MIKKLVISTLAALTLLPSLASAQSTYSECQRSCVSNGLSCVLRCVASGSRSTNTPPPPSFAVPQQQLDVGSASIWNLPAVSTLYSTRKSPSFPSAARNFPPPRPYNSEHTTRRNQYNR